MFRSDPPGDDAAWAQSAGQAPPASLNARGNQPRSTEAVPLPWMVPVPEPPLAIDAAPGQPHPHSGPPSLPDLYRGAPDPIALARRAIELSSSVSNTVRYACAQKPYASFRLRLDKYIRHSAIGTWAATKPQGIISTRTFGRHAMSIATTPEGTSTLVPRSLVRRPYTKFPAKSTTSTFARCAPTRTGCSPGANLTALHIRRQHRFAFRPARGRVNGGPVGRPVDPDGWRRALAELCRHLAVGCMFRGRWPEAA